MDIPKNKVVKVYWSDHSSDCIWKNLEELKQWAKENYNENETLGEIVIDEKDYIVIISEKNMDKEYGLYTMILKNDIKKITILS